MDFGPEDSRRIDARASLLAAAQKDTSLSVSATNFTKIDRDTALKPSAEPLTQRAAPLPLRSTPD